MKGIAVVIFAALAVNIFCFGVGGQAELVNTILSGIGLAAAQPEDPPLVADPNGAMTIEECKAEIEQDKTIPKDDANLQRAALDKCTAATETAAVAQPEVVQASDSDGGLFQWLGNGLGGLLW